MSRKDPERLLLARVYPCKQDLLQFVHHDGFRVEDHFCCSPWSHSYLDETVRIMSVGLSTVFNMNKPAVLHGKTLENTGNTWYGQFTVCTVEGFCVWGILQGFKLSHLNSSHLHGSKSPHLQKSTDDYVSGIWQNRELKSVKEKKNTIKEKLKTLRRWKAALGQQTWLEVQHKGWIKEASRAHSTRRFSTFSASFLCRRLLVQQQ